MCSCKNLLEMIQCVCASRLRLFDQLDEKECFTQDSGIDSDSKLLIGNTRDMITEILSEKMILSQVSIYGNVHRQTRIY